MPSEGVASVTYSSGLPTLSQLRELVYVPLRDSERTFVEAWTVDALLNEAYLDLNARLRLYQKSATGTTSATGTVAYPTDLVEMIDFWIGSVRPEFMDDDSFKSFSVPATSTPYGVGGYATTIARVFNQTIETYPALTSTAYTLEYVARPTLMTADSDTPTQLTRELVPRIVSYARAYAKWQEGEQADGDRYWQIYEEGLPGRPRMKNRMRPQTMTLIPDVGPFDA